MKYQCFFPIKKLMKSARLSERVLASESELSRATIRSAMESNANITIKSLQELGAYFNRDVAVVTFNENLQSEYSTIGVAIKVTSDGFDSWKIHFMNLVDEFRRTLNPLLLLLPPPSNLNPKLAALLASIVRELSKETAIDTPTWAKRSYFLDTPWFPAGMESLKATALLESPLSFRANNIFVQENFLSRA